MDPSSLAKKLFRTFARVIPQCGMVSQAVAFNMFLAFFPTLLVALGLVSSSLRGKSGQELAVRLSEILPPGSWQLVSELLLQREVNAWQWVFFGWVGTLLVGSQVMKLIMAGIQLIYGDHERHSFLGRQLRGLILFAVSVVAWLVAVALSVFAGPVRQWMIRGLRGSWPDWYCEVGMAPQFPGSDGWENARPHARLSGPIRRHYFRIARRSGGTSVRPLAIVMTLLVLVETQFRARRKCHCFCLSLNSANQF